MCCRPNAEHKEMVDQLDRLDQRLEQRRAVLQAQERRLLERDAELQRATNQLLEAVEGGQSAEAEAHATEARLRAQLLEELAAQQAAHEEEARRLREECSEVGLASPEPRSPSPTGFWRAASPDRAWAPAPRPGRALSPVGSPGGSARAAEAAATELQALEAEFQSLCRERDAELQAAAEFAQGAAEAETERDAARQRQDLQLMELRTHVTEAEALQNARQGLEGEARTLSTVLGSVSSSVAQRNHEIRIKDLELGEVHRSLFSIQDEMDEVNRQLQEQCGRVARVEGTLHASRDLHQKLQAMRGMLRESHAALAQLCGVLEAERGQRDECAHGLKQQKVRTELLLQLLHHLKGSMPEAQPGARLDVAGAAPGDLMRALGACEAEFDRP